LTACLLTAGYLLIFQVNTVNLTRAGFIFAFYILAIGSMITIFFHDLYEMYISDYLSYFFLAAALGFSLLYYQDWQLTLMGAFVVTLPIALIVFPSHGRWMGEGDVKLALGLGIITGYPGGVITLVMAFLLGGFYGALALIARKAKLKTAVPFAPFLILGGLIALFYGTQIVDWYLGFLGYGWYY
jgi:prepilin signal peptidase PulO-like enzyme (type II secretory pathway)